MLFYKVSTKLLIIPILSIALISTAYAEDKGYIAFELGQTTVDDAVAVQEGVKNTASYVRLSFEKQYGSWSVGGGLSGFLYSDNEGFKQNVVNQFGAQSTASSSASATNLFVEGGYVYTVSETLSVDLMAGYEFVINSSRSISNCSDCSTDTINIDAGMYLAPRFAYQWDSGFKLGLFYRQYLSGDVTSTIGLNFAWRI